MMRISRYRCLLLLLILSLRCAFAEDTIPGEQTPETINVTLFHVKVDQASQNSQMAVKHDTRSHWVGKFKINAQQWQLDVAINPREMINFNSANQAPSVFLTSADETTSSYVENTFFSAPLVGTTVYFGGVMGKFSFVLNEQPIPGSGEKQTVIEVSIQIERPETFSVHLAGKFIEYLVLKNEDHESCYAIFQRPVDEIRLPIGTYSISTIVVGNNPLFIPRGGHQHDVKVSVGPKLDSTLTYGGPLQTKLDVVRWKNCIRATPEIVGIGGEIYSSITKTGEYNDFLNLYRVVLDTGTESIDLSPRYDVDYLWRVPLSIGNRDLKITVKTNGGMTGQSESEPVVFHWNALQSVAWLLVYCVLIPLFLLKSNRNRHVTKLMWLFVSLLAFQLCAGFYFPSLSEPLSYILVLWTGFAIIGLLGQQYVGEHRVGIFIHAGFILMSATVLSSLSIDGISLGIIATLSFVNLSMFMILVFTAFCCQRRFTPLRFLLFSVSFCLISSLLCPFVWSMFCFVVSIPSYAPFIDALESFMELIPKSFINDEGMAVLCAIVSVIGMWLCYSLAVLLPFMGFAFYNPCFRERFDGIFRLSNTTLHNRHSPLENEPVRPVKEPVIGR